MNDAASFPIPFVPVPPKRYPWYHWRRLGFNFLTVSIAAHLFFGVGAAYLIVQTIQAKRKQTFAGPAQSPNAPTRAIEHQVQMQKKRKTMSAPAAVKRITTTSNTKIALPAMPPMPQLNTAIVPLTMSGMGGTGVGLGMGGSGGGTGGGGGGGMPLFGFRQSRPGTLIGYLYDLKQDPKRQSTNMTADEYSKVVSAFVRGGFNVASLSRYYRASSPLYATRIFTPTIQATEGPKAFGVENEVKPLFFVVVYQGRVIPSESGTYHFVAFGDDVMVIKFAGRVVLDRGYVNPSGLKESKVFHYQFNGGGWYGNASLGGGHGEGLPMQVEAGRPYDMQVLIGERPGGQSLFQILLEKDGVEYKKDAVGNPIFPVFRLSNDPLPEPSNELPPFDPDGPIWKAVAPSTVPALGL